MIFRKHPRCSPLHHPHSPQTHSCTIFIHRSNLCIIIYILLYKNSLFHFISNITLLSRKPLTPLPTGTIAKENNHMPSKLMDFFNKSPRIGTLSTADMAGNVDSAVFGSPRMTDEKTVVMGL